MEEVLLALVEVGAQLDQLVGPQVDDPVVDLLVAVLAPLLGYLRPMKGGGQAGRLLRARYARCAAHPSVCLPRGHALVLHTLSPSGSSCVFSTETTESSVALFWSLLSAVLSFARFAASRCTSMHSSSFDSKSSSAIAPAPSSACITFFCEAQGHDV